MKRATKSASILLHALTSVGLLLQTGCFNRQASDSGSSQPEVLIVTSTHELRLLIEPVVSSRVRVEALASKSSDGHDFEYSSKHLLLLKNADYVIGNGLGLDNAWLTKGLRASGKSLTQENVLWMSNCVKSPIESHSHEKRNHVHKEGNPHWILDPGLAPELWACLAAKWPAEKASLLDGAKLKTETEKSLQNFEKMKALLQPLQGLRVVSLHRNLSYFLKRFGLAEVVLEGVNNVEQLRPSLVNELVNLHSKKQVDALLTTSEMDPRLATQLREQMPGLQVFQVRTYTSQQDYPSDLHQFYDRLAEGFHKRP